MSQHSGKTTSEEVDQRHLDLASEEGAAYRKSVEHMIEDVAHTGAVTETGDYVVGIAQEKAEGLYALAGEGEFEFREPDAENCHLEVVVADADDGRFVPELDVQATFTSQDGDEIGPVDLPFLWHPGLYHYGANVKLPGDGTYDVRVEVEAPTFHRHDEQNGDRYGEDVEVVFEGVDVKTGQG